MSIDRNVLLERHRPLLKYDSNESYFADSAEAWTDWRDNQLLQGEKLIAAATPTDGTPKLSLPFLAPDKYIYNDFNLIGNFFKAGLHEGDWEMIQLRLDENDVPDYAVYAQHKEAEVRRWHQVDVLAGTERPFAYVARGSHASYFSPGKHPTGAWWDFADGARRSPDVRLEIVDEQQPAGRWLLWPGHWGGTKKPKHDLPFDADSPVGPCGHSQWDDPSTLAPDLPAEAAVARKAAPPAPPVLREVQARREGNDLLIDYEAESPEGRGLRGLVVTLNSPDEAGVPPLSQTIESSDLSGTVKFPEEIDPDKGYDVQVSAAFDDHMATESRPLGLAPAA